MLEINNLHKKADLSNLKAPVKKAKLFFLGFIVSTSIYTGSINLDESYAEENALYSQEEIIDDFSIPEVYQKCIEDACGKSIQNITSSDLNNINNLTITIYENDSLSFLEGLSNLESLEICFEEGNNTYCLDTIPNLPNLKNLIIRAHENVEISSKVNSGFIKNCPNVEYLDLEGITIGPNSIENMNSLKELKLGVSLNNDFDYSKTNLESLDLTWYGAYDIPIFLNREDYNSLKSKGTDIIFGSSENEEKYNELLDKIDNDLSKMDITSSDTEKEKIQKIVSYVLEDLEYDPDVLEKIINGEDVSDYIAQRGFYKYGNLYGAYEMDYAICGNYVAEIRADLNRENIDNSYMVSNVHAWNLVKVEGELYYIDATALDFEELSSETIKEGEGESLEWYLEDVDSDYISSIDPSGDHEPILFPEYIEDSYDDYTETENVMTYDSSNEKNNIKESGYRKVEFIVNNKKYVIPLAAFMGILVALGRAKKVHRKKKSRRKVKKIKKVIKHVPNKDKTTTVKKTIKVKK